MILSALLTGVISASPTQAQTQAQTQTHHHSDDHQNHNHSAHTHGTAQLHLVIDGHEALWEFITPAANLLGFEHAPHNKAQSLRIAQVEQQLEHINTLLNSQTLDCSLFQHEIEMPFARANSTHHKSDEHTNNGHSEIRAEYHLSCSEDQALNTFAITLFEHFPALEKIEMLWITPLTQGSTVLTPNRNTFRLPQ